MFRYKTTTEVGIPSKIRKLHQSPIRTRMLRGKRYLEFGGTEGFGGGPPLVVVVGFCSLEIDHGTVILSCNLRFLNTTLATGINDNTDNIHDGKIARYSVNVLKKNNASAFLPCLDTSHIPPESIVPNMLSLYANNTIILNNMDRHGNIYANIMFNLFMDGALRAAGLVTRNDT